MPQTDQTPDLLPNYDGTYNSYYPDGDKPEPAPDPEPEPGEPPVITGVTGTIAQGETITITGSNFSTYRSSTLFFTDFSEGQIGESVVDTIAWLDGASGTDPRNYLFSDEAPLTGTQIARADAVESAPGNLFAVLNGLDECYVEFVHRKVKTIWDVEGENSPQIKTTRLSGGMKHGDRPHIGIIEQSGNIGAPKGRPSLVYTFASGSQKTFYPSSGIFYEEGQWHRDSLYLKLSDPDVSNGEWWYRTSITNQWSNSTLGDAFQTPDEWSEPLSVTRTLDIAESLLETMWFCWYTRSHQSTTVDIDCIYINDSRERVMLSTSPIITASSDYHHVCCPTTAKTGDSIAAKLMLDALPDDSPVYLYVFNHDGSVNENGYQIRSAS